MAKQKYQDVKIKSVTQQLLKEFDAEVVAEYFPGGRSEAIRTLMRGTANKQRRRVSLGDAQPKNAWCPICQSNLSIIQKDGRKILNCKLHGEMNTYLDQDPKKGGKI